MVNVDTGTSRPPIVLPGPPEPNVPASTSHGLMLGQKYINETNGDEWSLVTIGNPKIRTNWIWNLCCEGPYNN